MAGYKLLVMDIDGTLLDKNGVISTANREAVAQTLQSGIKVSLSTGRATGACLKVLSELLLDGFHIFFDGALVCNHSQSHEVYAQPINPTVLKEAIDYAAENGIPLELYSADNYFAEHESWRTEIHRDFFGMGATVVPFADLWQQERIIKGGIVVSTPEEEARVKRFGAEFKDRLNLAFARTPAYPGLAFINVLSPGVSKGKALEALVAHLGIPMKEVMAIGDGFNDISLLTTAGMSVAMQNAPDEVKVVADYVTAGIDDSGLAAAIRRFLLQESR